MNRICLLVNTLPPYRVSVFRELNRLSNLHIYLQAESEIDRGWSSIPVESSGTWIFNLNLPKLSLGELYLYLPNLNLIKLHRYEHLVIGGWESPANLLLLMLAKFKKRSVTLFYESTQKSHRFKRGPIAIFRSLVMQKVDSVIAPGSLARDAVVAMGVPADRVIQSFNTVDVEWFHENSLSVRSEASDGHTFIYVGQLIGRKNIETLITAFSGLAESDRLVIVGKGQDRARLEKLSEDLGISSRVSFVGSKNGLDLVAEYGKANTLVLPSKQEVWGLVVNEALACGLHVVVSDVCGVSADTKHMNGVFVTGIDAETIREGMQSSKKAWAGHIEQPEILKHTPEQLAADILKAVELGRRK
jgi:glycosyltransferase involved in cell wall biosynthesis